LTGEKREWLWGTIVVPQEDEIIIRLTPIIPSKAEISIHKCKYSLKSQILRFHRAGSTSGAYFNHFTHKEQSLHANNYSSFMLNIPLGLQNSHLCPHTRLKFLGKAKLWSRR
jgi:hypothetical protein